MGISLMSQSRGSKGHERGTENRWGEGDRGTYVDEIEDDAYEIARVRSKGSKASR
jgi:hypothetical protein